MSQHVTDCIVEAALTRYPEVFGTRFPADPEALVRTLSQVLTLFQDSGPYISSSGYSAPAPGSRLRYTWTFGTLDPEQLRVLVSEALESGKTPAEVPGYVGCQIRTAMELADALPPLPDAGQRWLSPRLWQDVLAELISDPVFRGVVEALTVDGRIVTELVVEALQ